MRHSFGFMLIALVAGCSAQYPGSPTPTPSLAGVRIHYINPHQSISPGSSASLALYAFDTEGAYELVTSRASWFSSNSAVVTVTNGTARGVTAGTADVVASYQGLSATARIFVVTSGTQFFPLLRILTSSPETGRTLRVSADYFATPSSSRNVGAEATWTSSDPAVFTAEAGEITGRAPGTAILTATYNGAQGSSFVSVPPMRTLP